MGFPPFLPPSHLRILDQVWYLVPVAEGTVPVELRAVGQSLPAVTALVRPK